MRSRTWIALIGLALGVVVVSEAGEAWARAGGGGGGGSRGSRSYSSPARPAPASPTTPSSPSRSLSQPAAPVAPARPSMFGGLMGGIAGFALGGLLGSMLFGGMGHGFGGIGMMDVLLIGGGLALLFMFLRRRRAAAEQPQPAYAGMGGGYRAAEPEPAPTASYGATAVAEPPTTSDVDRGLGHIRSMDGGFDPDALVTRARDVFFDVQAGVTARDMSKLRERITPEMYSELQRQCDELRAARRTNRVERIDLRRSEITEAWQESGRDYVTVYFSGALLDYTVDDTTGAVVAGSATDRDALEEFWTFSRPVGPNPWQLSAIQTG
ncbi:MAG TPA: Tim44 domain-containing protein [Methylomirabilota bacterium]|nr:Tim44 domain-containing protein [Methylomirabilota bacterium]